MVAIHLELAPELAAALKRFAEKVSYDQANAVLYPHVKADIRSEQADQIMTAFSALEKALSDADVKSWPWIDSGRA